MTTAFNSSSGCCVKIGDYREMKTRVMNLSRVAIDRFFKADHAVIIPLTVREILDEHPHPQFSINEHGCRLAAKRRVYGCNLPRVS